MKKNRVFYVVCVIVLFLCVLLALVIPETGEMTLLNEVFAIGVFAVFEVMLLRACIAVVRSKNIRNIVLVAATIVVIGFVGGSKLVHTVRDVVAGPEYVNLYHCDLERRSTMRGIFSLQYYINGLDEDGNRYRLRISGTDYDLLQGENEVTVLYYKNTKRIIHFEEESGRYE